MRRDSKKSGGELVALSETMNLMIQQMRQISGPEEFHKFADSVYEGMQFYKAQFAKMPAGKIRAHSIHVVIDNLTRVDQKRRPAHHAEVKCQRGCSHCCHNYVITTPDEADLLYAAMKEDKIEVNMARLEKQAQFKGTDGEYFRQPLDENRCVFLGAANECRVYEHRPIACRKYLVASDPTQCAVRGGDNKVAVLGNIDIEIIASAALDLDHNCGNLPEMLWKRIQKEN